MYSLTIVAVVVAILSTILTRRVWAVPSIMTAPATVRILQQSSENRFLNSPRRKTHIIYKLKDLLVKFFPCIRTGYGHRNECRNLLLIVLLVDTFLTRLVFHILFMVLQMMLLDV